MTAYERDLLCRREAYIMAKRSPWHLWSVQALRAGYVPPLIPGTIPPDIPRILPVGFPFDSLGSSMAMDMPRLSTPSDSRMAAFGRGVLGVVLSVAVCLLVGLVVYSIMKGGDFQIAMLSRMGH
ncbi:MAG TPA: hypothetical protein PLZ55_03460 [bacterium]|mgnify:CR=1 FL=1|nr:hypothetical protein [bacterium]HPO07701.1 hypothetical protein [bacterium]HQO34795.1 hypothetical protein [bacterium]HQP98144.1 hypothetical protein [bacterium]